jgi:hypothetical protein
MKKIAVSILTLFISSGIFYSCAETPAKAKADDVEQASLNRMSALFMTPDSLRTAEEKALFQKTEMLFYEGSTVKDGRIEIIFEKEDLRKRGIPEIYYNAAQKDVDVINNYLDTTSVFLRDLMLEAFMKSREEYFARKDSSRLE